MELVNAYGTGARAQAQPLIWTGYISDLLQLDAESQVSLPLETSDPCMPRAPTIDPTEEEEQQVNPTYPGLSGTT